MSKSSLQEVLKRTLENMNIYSAEGGNDFLRRKHSGIESHIIEFSPRQIIVATRQSFRDEKIEPTPTQLLETDKAAYEFANALKAAWGTKGYVYEAQASGTNVFRKTFEGQPYKGLKRAYNAKLNEILNTEKKVSFVDAGHSLGSGVSETSLAYALGSDLKSTVEIIRSVKERTELHSLIEKIPNAFLTQDKTAFRIKVEIESKGGNRGTASKINFASIPEKEFMGVVRKQLESILSKENWGAMEGSPSPSQEAINAIIAAGTGKKTPRGTVSRATLSKITVKEKKVIRDKTPAGIKKISKEGPREWISMIGLINSMFPSYVRKNMGSPRLNNRTGAFADSARVSSITTTPQGFPSIGLTFNKKPYGVFSVRGGAAPWANADRDPHSLLEFSFRQMARDLALNRFYLRRE